MLERLPRDVGQYLPNDVLMWRSGASLFLLAIFTVTRPDLVSNDGLVLPLTLTLGVVFMCLGVWGAIGRDSE